MEVFKFNITESKEEAFRYLEHFNNENSSLSIEDYNQGIIKITAPYMNTFIGFAKVAFQDAQTLVGKETDIFDKIFINAAINVEYPFVCLRGSIEALRDLFDSALLEIGNKSQSFKDEHTANFEA